MVVFAGGDSAGSLFMVNQSLWILDNIWQQQVVVVKIDNSLK